MKALELLFLRIAIRLNHMHFDWLLKQYPDTPPLVAKLMDRSDERLCRYLARLEKLTGEPQ